MPNDEEYVLKCTDLMRNDSDPLWARIRELLVGKGVNPSTSILATSFPDDSDFEFGILITAEETVYQFGFDHLRKRPEEGVFREWSDLTPRWKDTPYREDVEVGLAVLRKSG